VAVQFLTRIPVPAHEFDHTSLARAAFSFPLVGLLIGATAASFYRLLEPHLDRVVVSLIVILYLVVVTGGLHEDALADAADGFGGGNSKDRILAIFRDSRIGSYGAIAIVFSITARVVLLSTMPLWDVIPYLIAAHVLCRWTVLPLGYALAPARAEHDGQGARLAQRTSRNVLLVGTLMALLLSVFVLRRRAIAPLVATLLVTWLTGRFYRSTIGGVTGDCFGATMQLTEIAVYLCAAWKPGAHLA
jgi:adenosylcobinamide-GDP ribazoletransferase